MGTSGAEADSGEPEFRAGNIKNQLDKWKLITTDPWILEVVQGYKLELESAPQQQVVPKPIQFSASERGAIQQEIENFLSKGIIIKSSHEEGEYISNIFTRPKKTPGKVRVILNLRPLNKHMVYHKFKMDTVHTVCTLLTQDSFLASLDLQDAYYSVAVHPSSQKYLKFFWDGQLYAFTCLPMGLATSPRVFTKLLKPVFAKLRQMGHVSSIYIDDILLLGDTFDLCMANVCDTEQMLTDLGFFVQVQKSVRIPTQIMDHLGFMFNTQNMTVGLTQEKIDKVSSLIHTAMEHKVLTIRQVAELIGVFISYSVGVEYGVMHYRSLEIGKIKALRANYGNFDANMNLSEEALSDMQWWLQSLGTVDRKLNHGTPSVVLTTDASKTGWGGLRSEGNKCLTTKGRWLEEESELHINVLEMLAIFHSLKALCSQDSHIHILCKTDNRTALAYIRNMGGCRSDQCNDLAKRIWEWCRARDIWLSITHIAGVDNTEADTLSRVFDDQTEWQLDVNCFQRIVEHFKTQPECDLFASRLNHQVPNYVSWLPDPGASAVDAFTMDWNTNGVLYAFPPFSLMGHVLQKIETEAADVILVAPRWPTQSWYPRLLRLLVQHPIVLPFRKGLVTLPFDRQRIHPLGHKLNLMACFLSGKAYRREGYQRGLRTSSSRDGETLPSNSMWFTSRGGEPSVLTKGTIPFMRL